MASEELFEYLDRLRLAELCLTLGRWSDYFRDRTLLEIGSGSGVQLRELRKVCRLATGVDLAGSVYVTQQHEPIIRYDGFHLPFPDASFDVLYSSNVLEHLEDPWTLHREMHRVLRPDGIGVHILPNHLWRIWSHLTHYPALPKKIQRYRVAKAYRRSVAAGALAERDKGSRSYARLLANVIMDPRHGEMGTRVSEIAAFHPSRWRRRFAELGWQVVACEPTGVFYTGGALLARRWSFSSRIRWARVLGSACHTYIVRPAG